MQRILIVDDEPDILEVIRHNLQQAGFQVRTAGSGNEALNLVDSTTPDLVILDVVLPDIDGMEVCRRLRGDVRFREIPVIMLTARGDEVDRVVGFELGADDYVTKPFSPRELVLRVRSILRRGEGRRSDPLRVGAIEIFPRRRECLLSGRPVALAAKEFDLLLALARAGGDVMTREALLEQIWGYRAECSSRTLDTHVRRLRARLGPEGDRLETVRGVGFRLEIRDSGLTA